MKAIILAAGVSLRLRPLTNDTPKTLLHVDNKPIISYTLDSLLKNCVKDVIVCVGYKASQIIDFCKSNYPQLNFIFVKNNEYDKTNNMYSLYLARKYFDDDIILFNGDSIHEHKIIEKMLKQEKTSIAVDRQSYDKESMKIFVDNKGRIMKMSKEIKPESCYGCSVDVFKIIKNDLKNLTQELERIIEKQKNRNEWIEVMLENLFRTGIIDASPVDISGLDWYEIDTHDDLKNARSLFSKKKN